MLIPKVRQKDLLVLYNLCTSPQVDYDSIANSVGISNRTCKESVKRTNEAIYMIFNISNFIVSNKNGSIHINQKYFQNKFEIFFQLRLFCYKDSPMAKLIVLIIEKHNLSREEAQSALFLSESSLNKLLPKLNHYLHPFSIVIISSNGLLRFGGNEISIRNFLFKFLYYTYLNIEWPFSDSLLNNLTQKLPNTSINIAIEKSDVRIRSYYIAVAVLIYRFSTHHFIKKFPFPELKVISEILCKFNSTTSSLFNQNELFAELQLEYRDTEKLIAEIFFRNYVPEIDSESLQVQIGQQFELVNGKITNLAQLLIEELDIEFNVSKQDRLKYLKLYQLVIFLSLKECLAETFIPFISMHTPKHPYLSSPENLTMERISKVTSLCNFERNETTDIINRFLYNLYAHEVQKKVSIYLEFSKDQSAPYYIKNKILSVYSESHILFTNHHIEADLIVSDTFDSKKSPKNFFYLLGIDDKKGWKDLFFKIQEISFQKIYNHI